MTRHHQKVWLSIVAAAAAAIYYLTPPPLSWAQCPPPGVVIGTEARINDPCGPDNECGTPPEPAYLDDDDGEPPHEDKAMRDPVIAAAIVNDCPVLLSAFSDHSLRLGPSANNLFSVGFARATDLGATWAATHNLARLDLPPPPGSPGGVWLREQKHPYVAAGGNGRLYMVGYDFRNTFADPNDPESATTLWLARTADQGSSWQMSAVDFAEAPDVSKFIFFRHPSVAAEPDGLGVFVTWTRDDTVVVGTSVWFAASADGGVTFSTPVQISPLYEVHHDELIVSTVGVGQEGVVYVVWFEPEAYGEIPTDRYVLRRSTDGGMNFAPQVEVVRFQGLSTRESTFCRDTSVCVFDPCMLVRPSLAVDTSLRSACLGRQGWLYMTYAHDDMTLPWPPGGFIADANVYVVVSRDGGETWEPPRAVHDLNPSPSGHLPDEFGSPSQYLPSVAVSDAGHVGVSFLSALTDILEEDDTPRIANQAYRVHFTYSVDGGCTFAADCPVESRYSLPRISDDPNSPENYYLQVGMTEYVGMTSYGRTFHPVWMSLRDWIGPPTQPRPDNWRFHRTVNRQWVGDIYTMRLEVTDGAAPDFDADCDVDLADFLIFQQCFGGSNNPPAPTCPPRVDADMDPAPCGDGDVDLADFLMFQQCFTGSLSGCVGNRGPCPPTSEEGGEGAGPQGMSPEPELPPEPEPTPAQLRRRLEDWCLAHGIPFT